MHTKAALNWRNHRITFIQAKAVFRDSFAAERIDEREDYGEERINRIGHRGGLILVRNLHDARAPKAHHFSKARGIR